MTDEAKRFLNLKEDAQALREIEWTDCAMNPRVCTTMMHKAADLIESLAAELEQVKAERDGLRIMLTATQSAAETYKRERDAIGWEYVKDVGMVCPERWNDYAEMQKRYKKRPPKVKED